MQKTNQKEFRIEKVIKKNGNKFYVKLKGHNNSFNTWIDKKEEILGRDINVEVDLSNYANNADLKNATGIDTSNLALKPNLAKLKTEIDKINADKLKPVHGHLSKLSNIVNNHDHVVKKPVYDKFVAKLNNIDTSSFVLKTKYDTNNSNLENELPDARELVKYLQLLH